MKAIRMLIVEDDTELASSLETTYREVFHQLDCGNVTVEKAESAEKARELARAAKSLPYDLVSLDVNLGVNSGRGGSPLTGLDVLTTLKQFRSAWMVALLTGVEVDVTLNKTLGVEEAEKMRKQLRSTAYARFWPERLLVVEKPATALSTEPGKLLLKNRLQQIALVYREVDRQRYIFRPITVVGLERVPKIKGSKGKEKRKFIETESLHWQIRYNCGDIRTLPDRAGYKTIHHLLSLDPKESLTPEAAMVVEPPDTIKVSEYEDNDSGNAIKKYFLALGIEWDGLSPDRQDEVIRAALSLKLKRYVELRGFQDEGDISPEEQEELERIIKDLGALAPFAETAYERMSTTGEDATSATTLTAGALAQDEMRPAGGNYQKRKGGWGYDSPDAELVRKRKQRALDYLRQNGFADLAQHLEVWIQSTGANWSYISPEAERKDSIEWMV